MAYIESITIPEAHIQNVFGQYDKNIKNIEKAYNVTVVLREDTLRIVGVEENVKRAVSVIEQMIKLSDHGNIISEQEINYAVSLTKSKDSDVSSISELDKDINIICHTINGKPVKAKTIGQKKYVDAIDNKIDYLREKRKMEVKAKIAKLPVKISVISVIFFVPLMLLIILGPIILSYIS